jgi:hypothetical protein
MNNVTKILNTYKEKIPSWKVDIVQNFDVLISPIPRKTYISGHFRLIPVKNLQNFTGKQLIYN